MVLALPVMISLYPSLDESRTIVSNHDVIDDADESDMHNGNDLAIHLSDYLSF